MSITSDFLGAQKSDVYAAISMYFKEQCLSIIQQNNRYKLTTKTECNCVTGVCRSSISNELTTQQAGIAVNGVFFIFNCHRQY